MLCCCVFLHTDNKDVRRCWLSVCGQWVSSGIELCVQLYSDWHLRWHPQRRSKAKRKWGGVRDGEGRKFVFMTHLFTVPVSHVPVLSPLSIPLLISLSLPPFLLSPLSSLCFTSHEFGWSVQSLRPNTSRPCTFLLRLTWLMFSYLLLTHPQTLSDRNTLLALALCRLLPLSKLDSNHWKILLAGTREESDRGTDKDSKIK